MANRYREANKTMIAEVRKLASNFPVKKMLRLDCGDQYRINQAITRTWENLHWLTAVSKAGCSIVIDALDELSAR